MCRRGWGRLRAAPGLPLGQRPGSPPGDTPGASRGPTGGFHAGISSHGAAGPGRPVPRAARGRGGGARTSPRRPRGCVPASSAANKVSFLKHQRERVRGGGKGGDQPHAGPGLRGIPPRGVAAGPLGGAAPLRGGGGGGGPRADVTALPGTQLGFPHGRSRQPPPPPPRRPLPSAAPRREAAPSGNSRQGAAPPPPRAASRDESRAAALIGHQGPSLAGQRERRAAIGRARRDAAGRGRAGSRFLVTPAETGRDRRRHREPPPRPARDRR